MTIPSVATVIVVIAGIVTVMTFFEKTRNWLGGGWKWIKGPISSTSPHRVDLRITPATGGCLWQEGSDQGYEAMLVYCRLFLTNIGPHASFQVLNVSVRKSRFRALNGVRNMQVKGISDPQLPEHLGARLAVIFDFRFVIRPPLVKSGDTFVCDIFLKDQFGHEHRATKVPFTTYGMAVWETMRERGRGEKEVQEKAAKQIQQSIKEVQDAAAK